MTSNRTRLWVSGTALLCVALLVASWFLLVSPKRAEAVETREQTVSTRDQNTALQLRIDQLEAEFADLPARQAELADIQKELPPDTALPTLVRDLDRLAAEADVVLINVSPGAPAPFGSAAATPVAAPAPAAGADGTAAPAAAAPPAATVLYGIPVSIQVVGDFFKAELFLKKVQADMRRTLLVQTLDVVSASDGGSSVVETENGDVTMTLTGQVFVLRTADQAPLAGPASVPPPAGSPAEAPAEESSTDPESGSEDESDAESESESEDESAPESTPIATADPAN